MQIYQRVLVWLNLTAPQLNHIQANAPPKAAESILSAPLKTYQDRDEYNFDLSKAILCTGGLEALRAQNNVAQNQK